MIENDGSVSWGTFQEFQMRTFLIILSLFLSPAHAAPFGKPDLAAETLARCMKGKIVLYSATYCNGCTIQLQKFAGVQFPHHGETPYFEIVSCSEKSDMVITNERCEQEKIEVTPTWRFLDKNGNETAEQAVGPKSLSKLAEWTGCKYK